MTYAMTDVEVAQEVIMIDAEEAWPRWPLLPVKNIHRGDKGYSGDGVGVIGCNEAGGKRTVYFKNLWEFESGRLGPQLEGVESKTFESTEALVRAGWIGD